MTSISHRHPSLLVLTLAALLTGCGAERAVAPGPSGAASEEALVAGELARHPEQIDEAVYANDPRTGPDAPVPVVALVDPLFFWRNIVRVERSYVFAFADTDTTGRPRTATVTVRKRLSGWFNLVVVGQAEGEENVLRKPLRDRWVRRLQLARIDDARFGRPWRIVASSAVEVTSVDAETRITSLRVRSTETDTTIVDPLAFWRVRRILHLTPGADVALTVTTLRPDDVVVLDLPRFRARFHAEGDGTYTLNWKPADVRGLLHFGVNALSRGTVFDDALPYDSQAWILPYRAVAEDAAALADVPQ
jgi:hypothetical protein